MTGEHCAEDIFGRLICRFGQGVAPLCGTVETFRAFLAGGRCLLRCAPIRTTLPRIARAQRACTCLLIRGAAFAIPAFMTAAIALNCDAPSSAPRHTDPIRVMIVDDHPIIRRALAMSLRTRSDFEVVGEASTGEEAVDLFKRVRPDVILMDVMMPGMGGVQATRVIHDMASHIKIIVFSYSDEAEQAQAALRAGAFSYLLKTMEVDRLFDAIHDTMAGIPVIAPQVVRSVIVDASSARKLGDDLTERERDVLKLLVQGGTNEDIAENLVITRATVKFHLRNIKSKLNTKSRTETVIVALKLGLVPPG